MRHRTPHFAHVFSGEGYATAYYGYIWSEVLTADVAERFSNSKGGFYNKDLSKKLVKTIFETQNTTWLKQRFFLRMTCATRNCRGRAATRPPLGLISAPPATPRSSDSASRQATPRCNLGMEGSPTAFAASSARLLVLAPAAGRDGIGACNSHPRATPSPTARCARELASVAPEPQVLLLRAPSAPPRPSNFAAGPSSPSPRNTTSASSLPSLITSASGGRDP